MDKKKLLVAVLILLVLVSGIFYLRARPADNLPAGKFTVTASFYPLYFFASEIGGDRAVVFNITPAGAEPHDYEPTAQDLARLMTSRLVILNGAGLESWSSDVEKNINPASTLVIRSGEGLAEQKINIAGQEVIDPHVWLSPIFAQEIVDKISAGFIAVDPVNRDYYIMRTALLRNKLAALDKEYQQGLSHCALKDIVTSHAAFGYLASAYGFNQLAIAGLSPDAEPSPRQVADLADFVTSRRIKYIFFESLASPKLAQTIATETQVKTLVLNPLEGLTPAELAAGQDYFTEMKNNLRNLQTALNCPIN